MPHHCEPLAHRRAEYDESHVARLRLIRAMPEAGEMRLEAVRRVRGRRRLADHAARGNGPAHYELTRGIVDGKTPSESLLAVIEA